jgi:hypothetical protein
MTKHEREYPENVEKISKALQEISKHLDHQNQILLALYQAYSDKPEEPTNTPMASESAIARALEKQRERFRP